MAFRLTANLAQTITRTTLGTPAALQQATTGVSQQIASFYSSSAHERKDTITVTKATTQPLKQRGESSQNQTPVHNTNVTKAGIIASKENEDVMAHPFFIKDANGKPTGEWHP